jgi:polyhydroxybutyrate depolymerase
LVGHTTRSYRLAVPTGYDPNRPTPLILLFHGWAGNAIQMSIYSAMPRIGAADGYLVATPDAIKGAWSLTPPGAHSADLRLVTALISALGDRYCIDLRKVYAAGFSLGSEFAAIAACTYPGRIAAIGLVSAEFLLKPCPRTVPVVAFHGTADGSVAYFAGGVGASLPGIHVPGVVNNLTDWARLDGCKPQPVIARLSSQILRRTWYGCRGQNSVVLYTVLGGGHTWPGSPIKLPALGMTTTQISATGTILAFFSRHELAAAAAGG